MATKTLSDETAPAPSGAERLSPASPDPGAATIRRASRRDIPLVASVLEMASRGHLERGPWDLIFPDEEERRRALEHLAGDAPLSWCHHSLFHVAEVGGEAVAALAAFEASDLGDTSLAAPLLATFAWLEWSPERISGVFGTMAPYAACFPDMPPGTWIVENVGTRADSRRRGLTRALLEHALAEGSGRGFERAQISCLVGNDPAQSAYERTGFEVTEERLHEDFEAALGSPGFSRMTRRLPPLHPRGSIASAISVTSRVSARQRPMASQTM
jgi:ribosomal protein S18 acetylase RimI-like enzyme